MKRMAGFAHTKSSLVYGGGFCNRARDLEQRVFWCQAAFKLGTCAIAFLQWHPPGTEMRDAFEPC